MLGQGGFGKVNLGLHRLTRKLVAIKSCKIDDVDSSSIREKRINEIEIMKNIRHENHIKLLETFKTKNHYCMVMELCPGGDL